MGIFLDDDEFVRNSFLINGGELSGNTVQVDHQDFKNRVDLVVNVGRVIQEVSSSEETLFDVVLCGEGVSRVSPTRLGRRFLKVLRRDHFQAIENYPDYKFNPYFEVFHSEVEASGLFELDSVVRHAISIGSMHAANVAELLNGSVMAIRDALKGGGVQEKSKKLSPLCQGEQ